MLSRLLSAKILAVGIAVAMMVTTVSIYAASISGTVKQLGGTGSVTTDTSAPSADVRSYTYDANGKVSGLSVYWTPAANLTYGISVTLTGTGALPQTVSCNRATAGIVARTDTMAVSPVVDAKDVTGTVVNIQELASGSTTCTPP